jgi:hypothetical protein
MIFGSHKSSIEKHILIIHCIFVNFAIATLLWKSVKTKLTLPKWGLGSPLGLPKFQSSIARVKTPRIGKFFISLEIYRSLNVQNGLAWPIWIYVTQVMAKRKVGSQTGNLTPDHGKSRIDPIPLRSGGVQHVVGKLSTRAITLVQTLSRSEVYTRSLVLQSCGTPIFGDFGTPIFGDFGTPETKSH